jgi:hypothetical protein
MEERADIIEADDEGFSDEVRSLPICESRTISNPFQGLDIGDNQSSLTSLSSSIVKGVEENGRTYASYGREGLFSPPAADS